MPYAPARLVLAAADALLGAHPLSVVTLPALLRAGRVRQQDPLTGVEFGSTEESELMEEFFTLPRPPEPDRPFRAPWSKEPAWQKRKYTGGSLQRMRTDASGRGRVLLQTKNQGGRDRWRITPQAGAELMSGGTWTRVRLIDLALWFGRDINTETVTPSVGDDAADDIDRLLEWFLAEFPPKGDLIGTVYDDSIPPDYREVPFEETPIGDDTFQQLGSLPPAPTVAGALSDLVTTLEQRISDTGYRLPSGLVRRVLAAWLRGDIVVLVGQPGTGKTLFATQLARAMEAEFDLDPPVVVAVRSDFDESEFIGYERLDGTPQLREFAAEVLDTDAPLEARVVILEEFNLAAVESYMASILVATQEPGRHVPLPGGGSSQLPIDAFFIATCNSYRDEPETRARVSSPTKRRATVITMPNVLSEDFEDDPEHAVVNLITTLVTAETRRVVDRRTSSRPSQFDGLRESALTKVAGPEDLSEAVRERLQDVSSAILSTSIGSSWFTIGLLRDVVLAIAHADRDEASELDALGKAVADKILHQVRGSHADIEALRAVCAQLPNAAETGRLFDRMMDGPSDELLPLL